MSEKLHVLGLPHTQTDGTYATCAYTARVIKFCRMMTGKDRKVILYSGEHNTAPCDDHVAVVTDEQQKRWFGDHDENDLGRGGFSWEWQQPWWLETNARAIGEIRSRADKTDLLCLTAGQSQQLVADALPEMIVAEIMVGYRGIILNRNPSPAFAAFESHSHRAMVYGEKGLHNFPREADVVIPNQFDPDELPCGDGGEYLLFVGRMIERKGLEYVCKISDALDMPLIVAGPGGSQPEPNVLRGENGAEWRCENLEYVGAVGVEARATLMGEAAVTLVPTLYAEPFGGVAVESMMCGTPVVTTDFGAFPETVREGISGYRFQTLQEAVDSTNAALDLDRNTVRDYALANYSLDAVRPMYERWFGNLDTLWGEGFVQLRDKITA